MLTKPFRHYAFLSVILAKAGIQSMDVRERTRQGFPTAYSNRQFRLRCFPRRRLLFVRWGVVVLLLTHVCALDSRLRGNDEVGNDGNIVSWNGLFRHVHVMWRHLGSLCTIRTLSCYALF